MSADAMREFFGEPVHVYSRAQAIADGELVDVSTVAREAGLRFPVAITRAVWTDCVAWTDADTARKGWPQDAGGRLWDVVWMLSLAIRRHSGGSRIRYSIHRVPVAGRGVRPRLVEIEAVCGPGDSAEPVITVQFPGED